MATWTASLPLGILSAPADHDLPSRLPSRTHPHPTSPDTAAPSTTNRALGIPDRLILQRIHDGDTVMYARLFEAYWPPLCESLTITGTSPDDAREIVADVFASIWERRAEWHVTTSIEAYLFGAVRHRVRRMYRDMKHRRALLERHRAGDESSRSAPSPSAASDIQMTIEHLVRALPPRAQMALYLRWHRECEYREIGEVLGISAEAARKLATRALEMLRGKLEGR